MKPLLAALATCWAACLSLAGTTDKDITYLDLQPKANLSLKENSDDPGNNLAELVKGEQTLEGEMFKIGEGLIQLSGKFLPSKPEEVDGIKVGRPFAKLHILHATGWGATGMEGDPFFVPDGTKIGQYTLHYADKTEEVIPIVYGEDVRDWWNWDDSKPTKRSKVAWKGDNPRAKQQNVTIRLYLTTWKNPKPNKTAVSIDYSSTNETAAAPFCVAMTAEGD